MVPSAMTLLDRTTLALSGPSVPGSPGPGGIPPAVGNSPGSATSAPGNPPGPVAAVEWNPPGPVVPAAGCRAGSVVPAAGNPVGSVISSTSKSSPGPGGRGQRGRPGPGVPGAGRPPDCGQADSAALRPARGAGVLIGLLRCGGSSGSLSLDGIGFRPVIGEIGPG